MVECCTEASIRARLSGGRKRVKSVGESALERGALYGGVEAGGTKFVCAVGTEPRSAPDGAASPGIPSDVQTISFPTTTPDETIGRVIDYFREQEQIRNTRLARSEEHTSE